MTTTKTRETLDELQSELNDLNALDIDSAITGGASCETAEDFTQNLDDAISAAHLLLSELKAIRQRVRE
jgi:hypothetical protein